MVAARERGGRTIVSVFKSEVDSLGFIIHRVNAASKLVTGEAAFWNALHAGFDRARIDRSKLYSPEDGTCSNGRKASSHASAGARSGIITMSLVSA